MFDFTPMLGAPAFAPLKDEAVFRDIYIDHQTPTWLDGAVDIAPEIIYDEGAPAEDSKSA